MDWKFLLTSFDGRINRAKFWAGIGVLFAVGIVAEFIDMVLSLHLGHSSMGLVTSFAALAAIYFWLALYTKRWHDRDKSGWWTLIVLVPVIGSLWALIELGILEGTRGSNQYADPFDRSQPRGFFGLSGRVSRAAYFLAGLLLAVGQAFPLYRFMLAPEESAGAQMWAVVFGVVFFASLWCNVALAVKRLHDFGKPGILAVSLFVPVISIAAFLFLCFFPGDSGENKYGDRTNAPPGGRDRDRPGAFS